MYKRLNKESLNEIKGSAISDAFTNSDKGELLIKLNNGLILKIHKNQAGAGVLNIVDGKAGRDLMRQASKDVDGDEPKKGALASFNSIISAAKEEEKLQRRARARKNRR